MNRLTWASAAALFVGSATLQQRPAVLDAFESPNGWRSTATDGPSLRISPDSGFRGHSLRLDFDVSDRMQTLAIRKSFNFALPPNYELAFKARGEGTVDAIKIGLADATGTNRWTSDLPVTVPRTWIDVVRKKRQLTSPRPKSPDLTRVATVDIGVTVRGKGSVWIDELQLRPRELDRPYNLSPLVAASSESPGFEARRALDGDTNTVWRSTTAPTPVPAPPPAKRSKKAPPMPVATVPPNAKQALVVDFLKNRELSGLKIDWEAGRHASDYTVELSADGRVWEPRYRVTGGNGGRDYVFLPESETRFLRLTLERGPIDDFGIRDITVEPVDWASSKNVFLASVARDAQRGSYPKYLYGRQAFWTAAAVDGDGAKVIVSDAGTVEPHRGGFSIEPFVHTDGVLTTWDDAKISQSLADGRYPMPSVTWDVGAWSMTLAPVTVLGGRDSSIAYLQYRLSNHTRGRRSMKLFLAVRPFQVVPPRAALWASPLSLGGAANVRQLGFENGTIQVNGAPSVVTLTPPAAFGATTFEQGNVVEFLREGRVPSTPNARDDFGQASGALAYTVDVDSGTTAVIEVAVPLHAASFAQAERERVLGARAPRDRVADERRVWRDAVERTTIELPPAAADIVNSLYASASYLLVNREGPALNGGPRINDRSCIADAALQAAALLRIGRADVVRDLLGWYASFQQANGSVPACVQSRTASLTPQHASHGAFIYLAAEYWRYTHDRTTTDAVWPNVYRAATYIDSLRQRHRTGEYQADAKRALYGLLPPSASRNGDGMPTYDYSDDFFALRGLKDAVELAHALARPEETQLTGIRDEFKADLLASMQFAIVQHRTAFLPYGPESPLRDPIGAALLVSLTGEGDRLPETLAAALKSSLAGKPEVLITDRGGDDEPYSPNTFAGVARMRLGDRDQGRATIEAAIDLQRPPGWQQWPEAVWSEPAQPKPAGDMPNSTAAASYISSLLDLFAYARESDSTLVLGQGIPHSWVLDRPGVTVRRLVTPYGLLSYTIRNENGNARVSMQAGLTIPPGGIVVYPPFLDAPRQTRVNGVPTPLTESGGVVVRTLPAEVVFRP